MQLRGQEPGLFVQRLVTQLDFLGFSVRKINQAVLRGGLGTVHKEINESHPG
ncbi:hypothetical protein GCM10008949_02570 [Deinococcus humi]|nr:hypothetical protein GCM10008949_02570 [Deinococcus humi]